MQRRHFLQTLAAAPAILSAQTPRPPNIVFILADDLGYGDIGCFGQNRIRTPNIDRLAGEGIRFTQAYSGSTVCAPSRCCLMTGKHTGHATIRGNQKPELGLGAAETTVASALKAAGYETALFGKWGLGGPGTGSLPNTRGFDHFYGYLDQQHAHNAYPEHLWNNQNEVFLTENWFHGRKRFAPDLFADRAIDFLAASRQKPFFLYFATILPHANNELGRIQANGMESPDLGPYGDRPWPEVEKTFAAAVTRVDSYVGRILEAIDRAGMTENTLVVFSSDNGPHAEGNHSSTFFESSGPFHGIKRDLYEGGIRVPAVSRWKGTIRPGQVSGAQWAFWDSFLPHANSREPGRRPASTALTPCRLCLKESPSGMSISTGSSTRAASPRLTPGQLESWSARGRNSTTSSLIWKRIPLRDTTLRGKIRRLSALCAK